MKKRIIFLLLCFAMCLSLLSVGSLADSGDLAATFSGGSGTGDNAPVSTVIGASSSFCGHFGGGDAELPPYTDDE